MRGHFFIKRLEPSFRFKSPHSSSDSIAANAFLYLKKGEVLVEIDGSSYLLYAGHIILIPENLHFKVKHFDEAEGYMGYFSSSLISESGKVIILRKPVHKAFWFDEAVFMGELFNMLELSFSKKDYVFISKSIDLMLSRIADSPAGSLSPIVTVFMDEVFDYSKPLLAVSEYAGKYGLSSNYFNRCVKTATSHSVSEWIDISRVNHAKLLLRRPETPIIDVSTAVGLEDQAYFSRFFKKNTGMSPSEFRKLALDKHE